MIAGITGGLGCGKSTVARLLERRGFKRLDSDAIVRDQILTEPAAVNALQAHFGPGVIGAGGGVDRSVLAARVFADDAERQWLEALTHPKVFAAWRVAFAAEPKAR